MLYGHGDPRDLHVLTHSVPTRRSSVRRTPLCPKGRTSFLPAMIAAVSLDEGPIAIHRTFLSTEASGKAAFEKPKRALGALGEAAVRLFAPVSGKLGLAEGVESAMRSEEHTSELQSLMRTSYAAFCLKKKNNIQKNRT